VKTPADNRLLLPTLHLANAIALEWDSQDLKIQPATMPLMTLSCTATDEMPKKRVETIKTLMNFLKSDYVIVRDSNLEVKEKQETLLDPLILWFSQQYNIPNLTHTNSIYLTQIPEETLMTLQWNLFSKNDWVFQQD
jgi:chaperone required for assembly of F1-ATPase